MKCVSICILCKTLAATPLLQQPRDPSSALVVAVQLRIYIFFSCSLFMSVLHIQLLCDCDSTCSCLCRCVCCVQCGSNSPGFHCEWQNNYTHCGPCASLVTCPVCRENFMEEELLLQCQYCDRWVLLISVSRTPQTDRLKHL